MLCFPECFLYPRNYSIHSLCCFIHIFNDHIGESNKYDKDIEMKFKTAF